METRLIHAFVVYSTASSTNYQSLDFLPRGSIFNSVAFDILISLRTFPFIQYWWGNSSGERLSSKWPKNRISLFRYVISSSKVFHTVLFEVFGVWQSFQNMNYVKFRSSYRYSFIHRSWVDRTTSWRILQVFSLDFCHNGSFARVISVYQEVPTLFETKLKAEIVIKTHLYCKDSFFFIVFCLLMTLFATCNLFCNVVH